MIGSSDPTPAHTGQRMRAASPGRPVVVALTVPIARRPTPARPSSRPIAPPVRNRRRRSGRGRSAVRRTARRAPHRRSPACGRGCRAAAAPGQHLLGVAQIATAVEVEGERHVPQFGERLGRRRSTSPSPMPSGPTSTAGRRPVPVGRARCPTIVKPSAGYSTVRVVTVVIVLMGSDCSERPARPGCRSATGGTAVTSGRRPLPGGGRGPAPLAPPTVVDGAHIALYGHVCIAYMKVGNPSCHRPEQQRHRQGRSGRPRGPGSRRRSVRPVPDGPDLDEIARDPRVSGVDFFRRQPKTRVDSPIGPTLTPNFYYTISTARLTMLAPSRAIRARLPRELTPLEAAPGLGLVSVMFFRYDVCDIDFYTEAAVGIAVRPARHGSSASSTWSPGSRTSTSTRTCCRCRSARRSRRCAATTATASRNGSPAWTSASTTGAPPPGWPTTPAAWTWRCRRPPAPAGLPQR